jgi:hypothetical protein
MMKWYSLLLFLLIISYENDLGKLSYMITITLIYTYILMNYSCFMLSLFANTLT